MSVDQHNQVSTEIPQNIPRTGAVEFVGRTHEIQTLHQMLQRSEQVAITGMGGIGKTELALQYALRYQKNYPAGLCWVTVKGANIAANIVSFGRTHLNLNPPRSCDLMEQLRFCWQHWPEGEVLVVLDDVTDYQKIEPYLPRPSQTPFKLLITTRARLSKPIELLDLNALTLEASLCLLKSLVKEERVERELKVAKELCEWLGYLPLGLELVGRYLAQEEDLLLETMRSRLENKRLKQRAVSPNRDDPSRTKYQLGIADTFELSWERLNRAAQRLGCMLSLFALAPIPWSFVEDAYRQMPLQDGEFDPEDLEEPRAMLVTLNLIKRTDKETYRLHQLIREFFQDKLKQDKLKQSLRVDDLKRGFCQAMMAKVKKLAPEYQKLRNEMKPGYQRTLEMEKIVAQARFLGEKAEYDTYNTKAMLNTGTPGERVIALGLLQAQKVSDSEAFNLVLQAISDSQSAFEQYHALLVAYSMVPSLDDSQKQQLGKTIIAQHSKYIREGTDRRYLSEEILAKIGLQPNTSWLRGEMSNRTESYAKAETSTAQAL